jgi:signal transduction histidine kinase
VSLTGGAESPMLPYLLAPTFALGLAGTWRHVLVVAASAAVGLAAGRLVLELQITPVPDSDLVEFFALSAQWLLLAVALGLVASWAQRLTESDPRATGRYTEARSLLEQLRGVARRLPGGLDLASAAEALLSRCSEVASCQRSAVLVQTGPGALVPAAVRGTQRVPWRAPLSEPGPLRQAWESGGVVVDRRKADLHGRRRGSALAVLPLSVGDGRFGLVILESFDEAAFPGEQLRLLRACVDEAALRLQTAVLFDEVRSTVTLEERDRLAREMHDGVAQELAFVGYQLDDLRLRVAKADPELGDVVAEVRRGLTRLISDIRLSITDLKSSVSNDRGLGAAITNYVRAVGSGKPLAVHVSLQESSFRLPGDAEVALFQVAQAVAQDARRTEAANLWVRLEVDPPSARLLVEHDAGGPDGSALDVSAYAAHVSRLGGTLHVGTRGGSGVRVEAVLEGGSGGDQRAAGR